MKKIIVFFITIISLLFMPIMVFAENYVGWQKIDGYWYYYTSSGETMKGWFRSNNNWYYFDNNGKMVTGLNYLSYNGVNNYYYFSEDMSNIGDIVGAMQVGWIKINNNWYYFDSTGAAVKGWKQINNNWYYFDDDGKMVTGLNYLSRDGVNNYYYFSEYEDYGFENVVVHIKNQTDLNNYLNNTGHNLLGDKVYFENTSDISFPEGEVYYLNANSSDIAKNNLFTYWYLTASSKGNINFNSSVFLVGEKTSLFFHATGDHLSNDNKQVISNGIFYGTVSNQINENGTITSNRGNFNADLIKASNIKFKNLTFNNIQDVNNHIFDVMGCNNIIFDNITSRGYFGDYAPEQLIPAYNYSNHSLYAEVIQIDCAIHMASGISDLDEDEIDIFSESMNDGTASTDITITNSYFGPYNGATGQSIINKENTTVIKPYGSTIGSHTGYTNGYSNIRVTNSSFVNTIYVNDSEMTKSMYPIHIQTENPNNVMAVENNTFINQYSGYKEFGIKINNNAGYYGNGTHGNVSQVNSNVNNSIDTTSVKSKVIKPVFIVGVQQTGLQTIDNNIYYFRNADNDISTGPKGSMVKGLVNINNNTYYFRNSKDEVSAGPEGSALKNACITINNIKHCFDSAGILTSSTIYVINKYSVDENYISKIDVNTDVATFESNFTLGTGYSVVTEYKMIGSNKVLYTGSKTRIMHGTELIKEYTNIVSGDTNGDGKLNYLDYVNVYNHIQKVKHPESNKKLLTGVYLIAGDMFYDNKISYLDYVRIYNKIKELKANNN